MSPLGQPPITRLLADSCKQRGTRASKHKKIELKNGNMCTTKRGGTEETCQQLNKEETDR